MLSRFTFLQSIPRDAKIIIFSNAFRSFSSALLAVSFPIYLSKIGASSVLIGITFMGIMLFSAIRSLTEGIVADRIGRKPILLFIATSLIIGGAIFVATTNITILLVAAVLFTVGGTITYTPAEVALLSDKVSDIDRTMTYSINATLATAASILGSFTGALPEALQRLGFPEILAYQQIFVIFVAVGVVCLILFTILKEVKPEPYLRESVLLSEQELGERKLLMKWSGVVALDQIGGSFNNLISYWYYLRFGVGPAEIGLITGLGRFIATLSFTLGLRMAKRFGTIRATAMSRIPIFIINILTPFMPSFAFVAASRLFMSIFSDIDVPLRQSYIMGVTRSKVRASTYGVVQIVSRFTSAGAPAITGYLYEFVSLSFPFYGAGFFQFASAASMYLLFKDIKPPEEMRKTSCQSPSRARQN
jgi:MFS family permease